MNEWMDAKHNMEYKKRGSQTSENKVSLYWNLYEHLFKAYT